ncbi:sodium:proton antiporter [soil metagenome]
MHDIALGLAAIIVLGVAAQLVADRLKLPSILLLLGVGIVAGPVTGFLDPDELLGDLLAPLVSLAVGIILFEGGLNLRFRQLRGLGRATWSLVTIGVAITWIITGAAAYWLLDLSVEIAVLLGAILVVSGPTVIIPLLRTLGPSSRIRSVLTWEAIFIDPVGAMLAVIVFDAVLLGGLDAPFVEVGSFLLVGVGIGVALAGVMAFLLGRFWVPDFLRTGVTLATVVLGFTVANQLVAESGLLVTTVMGLTLANQRWAPVGDITEFSENLQVLLIAALFVVLSARLTPTDFGRFGIPMVAFIAVIVLLARPLAVLASTARTQLERREKTFLALMAPRGIVAASISSVFAIQLEAEAVADAELLLPASFAVIIATVAIYGLSARWTGKWLGVANPDPQGLLLIGGGPVALAIAKAIGTPDRPVRIVAGNRTDHYQARMAEIDTIYGNVIGPHDTDDMIPEGVGYALMMTHNDEFNALAAVHLADFFGPQHVFQLVPDRDSETDVIETSESQLRGRWLFDRHLSLSVFERRLAEGWTISETEITEEFDAERFKQVHGDDARPLFIDNGSGLAVVTADNGASLDPGSTVFALVPPKTEDQETATAVASESA